MFGRWWYQWKHIRMTINSLSYCTHHEAGNYLNWSVFQYTSDTANQGLLPKSKFTKSTSDNILRKKGLIRGFTVYAIKHIRLHNSKTCMHTHRQIHNTHRCRDKQSLYLRLKKCHGYVHEIGDCDILFPILEFWIIQIRMRWKNVHGVDTAYLQV